MGKRGLLYERQKAMGASFGEWFGRELPAHFGDPTAEHLAVRDGVGVADGTFRGKVELTGSDRVRFLHGMVTNDVKSLAAGQGALAAILNAKGHVLSDLVVYALPDSLLLDLPAERAQAIRDTLDRFIIADQVEAKEVGGECGVLAVHGPRARDLVDAAASGPPLPTEEFQHGPRRFADREVRIFRVAYTGEEGYEILVKADGMLDLWDAVWKAGEPLGLRAVGMEALNSLRMEAGTPWYGRDMDESNIFPELGWDRAVSFTKGCYIGQEVVVRVAHQGHVNRKLMGLKVSGDSPPPAGAQAFRGDRPVARVTSAVFSPTLKQVIALAHVRREVCDPGTKLEVRPDGDTLEAEVAALPFYKRA